IKQSRSFAPDAHDGRIIHFGVREHAMGAALTGMSLQGGLIPFGGTFLCFSDYMRPAVRLAALSGVQVVYVFTHDSVGLGEDGPTHQPVEHVAALRAIPNLYVVRPADPHEVREAWRLALLRRDAPTALILTRQKVPTIDRAAYATAEGARRGAYVLAEARRKEGQAGDGATTTNAAATNDTPTNDATTNDAPDLIIIAAGSEVSLALEARASLQQEGFGVRVVSMPCWELFDEQPDDYREAVLPSSVAARLSVEAGVRQGWERYTGTRGDSVSLERFGASAPGDVALKNLGFNADNVTARARAVIERTKSTNGR
ncbi:MAG TPA: transketolase C-terminal domain-containing protein, partial [Pyrinomonadaceae bacterium]|nr:transketolase C-terminal domain-containing protein [Pyrinomonadaceae bacterium]